MVPYPVKITLKEKHVIQVVSVLILKFFTLVIMLKLTSLYFQKGKIIRRWFSQIGGTFFSLMLGGGWV